MKRITLLLVMLLAGYFSAAQDCGTYIELIGTGMAGESEATIAISEPDQVDSIIAEAIYKSYNPPVVPNHVKFWTDEEEILADPVNVPINGFQNEGVITSVFRATFEEPADAVHLDILDNAAEFYSLALFVFRSDGSMMSTMNGELYHVYKNDEEPLVMDIPVPVTDHPRDITLRFGISELNFNDARWAIFQFEANGEEVSLEVQEWDSDAGETKSYTIREVTFEDVPGNVDNIVVTMISENSGGDSYIAGIVLLDLPCEYRETAMYCTYTQGFYGNQGGRTCAGETTRELLSSLLSEDLVLGGSGNTLNIGAGDVDCLLGLLPGGGPSEALSGAATCDNLSGIETSKKGALKNTLLAQGITLALNLRNNPDLFSFPADGTIFVTLQPMDCMHPEAGGVPGTEMEHAFSQEIANYLGEETTIGNLMDLVNRALAGEDISPLSLSQVSDAATFINETFDECRIVLEEAGSNESGGIEGEIEEGEGNEAEEGSKEKGDQEDESATKGTTGVMDDKSNALGLYPNPVVDRFFINLPSEVENVKAAAIYSITGMQIMSVVDQVKSLSNDIIGIDAGELMPGIYIIKVDTDAGTFIQRFGTQ